MTGITQNVGISIHAPVKGATPRGRKKLQIVHISIHAPVKGATAQGGNPALPALNFNPRSREGSDLGTQQDARPEQQFQSTLPRRERLYALRR